MISIANFRVVASVTSSAAFALVCSAALSAQSTPVPASHPAVKTALANIERDNAWTLNQQVALCEIPAPPFKETARGVYFRDQLTALGLQHVRVDGQGNVIGELRGSAPGQR